VRIHAGIRARSLLQGRCTIQRLAQVQCCTSLRLYSS
jgi:hypothetical protein